MAAAVSVDEHPQVPAELGNAGSSTPLEPTPELHVKPTHATRHSIEPKVDVHVKTAREAT